MFRFKFSSLVFFFSVFLTACGGGSSDSSVEVDSDIGSVVATNLNNSASRPKIYLYETGEIVYDIRRETHIPELSYSNVVIGTKRFIFKDWGNIRLEEIKTETTTTSLSSLITGEVTTEVTTQHELEKWDTPKSYDVDFENQKIDVMDFSPVLELLSNEALVNSIAPAQIEPLSVEGVKIVALRSCTVKRVNELFTSCLHGEGINVSAISLEDLYDDSVGSTSSEKAKSAHFDIFIDDSEFELPDYDLVE